MKFVVLDCGDEGKFFLATSYSIKNLLEQCDYSYNMKSLSCQILMPLTKFFEYKEFLVNNISTKENILELFSIEEKNTLKIFNDLKESFSSNGYGRIYVFKLSLIYRHKDNSSGHVKKLLAALENLTNKDSKISVNNYLATLINKNEQTATPVILENSVLEKTKGTIFNAENNKKLQFNRIQKESQNGSEANKKKCISPSSVTTSNNINNMNIKDVNKITQNPRQKRLVELCEEINSEKASQNNKKQKTPEDNREQRTNLKEKVINERSYIHIKPPIIFPPVSALKKTNNTSVESNNNSQQVTTPQQKKPIERYKEKDNKNHPRFNMFRNKNQQSFSYSQLENKVIEKHEPLSDVEKTTSGIKN